MSVRYGSTSTKYVFQPLSLAVPASEVFVKQRPTLMLFWTRDKVTADENYICVEDKGRWI